MFGHHRRRQATDHVQPDLPITPMLDMSFQLMAFFIFTFRPAPTEGQLLLALPKNEGGGEGIPNPTEDKPVNFIVRVTAASNGTIADMTIIEGGSSDVRPLDLGADFKTYQGELKKRVEALKGKPSKLTLELADNLLWEHVVRLIDIAVDVGFKDLAPVPIDPKKR